MKITITPVAFLSIALHNLNHIFSPSSLLTLDEWSPYSSP
jgi:hypothetical protein